MLTPRSAITTKARTASDPPERSCGFSGPDSGTGFGAGGGEIDDRLVGTSGAIGDPQTKSETRNSKSETNPKFEGRRPRKCLWTNYYFVRSRWVCQYNRPKSILQPIVEPDRSDQRNKDNMTSRKHCFGNWFLGLGFFFGMVSVVACRHDTRPEAKVDQKAGSRSSGIEPVPGDHLEKSPVIQLPAGVQIQFVN